MVEPNLPRKCKIRTIYQNRHSFGFSVCRSGHTLWVRKILTHRKYTRILIHTNKIWNSAGYKYPAGTFNCKFTLQIKKKNFQSAPIRYRLSPSIKYSDYCAIKCESYKISSVRIA